MAISTISAFGTNAVPENPKQYVATIDVIVTAESELAAVDRIADLGRRLTEDCEIADWSFQSLEPFCGKGGAHGR